MSPLVIITTIIIYLGLLFGMAKMADQHRFKINHWTRHPIIYALALGVYCTSWTFYGLVGTAAHKGWYFLPILLGPIIVFTFGFPLLQRISRICRRDHIHSIADFMSSRYGKRQSIAALTTLLVLIAMVPYIALQLKAVSDTLIFIVNGVPFSADNITLLVALAMIFFTLFFGANRLDIANYHAGIMTTIAFESLVKWVSLMAIAVFALYLGFTNAAYSDNAINSLTSKAAIWTPSFWILTGLSAASVLCLPRMFQVGFVECLGDTHLKWARVVFPLYLIGIALAIFTIASTGNHIFNNLNISSDTYVLALPLLNDQKFLALLAFLGGFSAATAMIIVATLTLSQMLSNDVILPILLASKRHKSTQYDYSKTLFTIRRTTVVLVIGLAWLYQHTLAENVALTEIGLIAFALIVQLAPAIVLGVYWSGANALGALSGTLAGAGVWFFTLMLPHLCYTNIIDPKLIQNGLWGLTFLKPTQPFGLALSDSFTQGAFLSLFINTLVFYLISKLNITRLSDRIQAVIFTHLNTQKERLHLHPLKITNSDLTSVLQPFLGLSATEQLINQNTQSRTPYASDHLLINAEKALAGIVGVASARALLSNVSDGMALGIEHWVNIFEETTKSLQFNQALLEASFESISSAICVIDTQLNLVAWNKRYEQLFNYPPELLKIGNPISELILYNAQLGRLGSGEPIHLVQTRLNHLASGKNHHSIWDHNQLILEIRGRPLPKGGYLTTYDDITDFINNQKALESTNLQLEDRVKERTQQIEIINYSLRAEIDRRTETENALTQAKAAAEAANASKTLFLAAASHDVLQPLNAAQLYTSALLNSQHISDPLKLGLEHLQSSIEAAESIISNLLDIAQLDAGAFKPTIKNFQLSEILTPLIHEFSLQSNPNITFNYRTSSRFIKSDPLFLRRILQNFLSNAFKYTTKGKILLGCRRQGDQLKIAVYDTGIGISETHIENIFNDFYRVQNSFEGAGLGLGIALRFARLLDHPIAVTSQKSKGSVFSLQVPLATAPQVLIETKEQPQHASNLMGVTLAYLDDDATNLHAMQMLVSQWGCTLLGCLHPSELRDVLRQRTVDALLIDYHLNTDINGIDLALEINVDHSKIPICIVSAEGGHLHSLVSQQGFAFLRKPIKPGKLRALLDSYRF